MTKTKKITPKIEITKIPIYQGGLAGPSEEKGILKLSANENPYGPSPKAIKAYTLASKKLALYPRSDHWFLRKAIANYFGLDFEKIICGAGSDELIHMLCQCYAGSGDQVIHTEHGFAMYRISALSMGATPVKVAEHNRRTNVEAILEACNEKTKLIFIANPNNPTGTMVNSECIEKLVDNVPKRALVVLDGAYAEYIENFDAGAKYVDSKENVFMLRTFSKIFGLGSLRVGWGYGSTHVINALLRVKPPFNVSTPAQEAAQAALQDIEHIDKCRVQNESWRNWLSSKLCDIGLPSDPSFGNFILIRLRDVSSANAAYKFLINRGIFVRKVDTYGLPNSLRITIGKGKDCRKLFEALKIFQESNNGL